MRAANKLHSNFTTMSLGELEDKGYLKLGRGNVISKNDISNAPGVYPVYSSAKQNDGKFGEYNEYMFDEELITWSVDGGGHIFYRPKHKFSVTNVGGTLRVTRSDRINCRFLFYVLDYLHSTVKFDWVQKAHPSVIRKVYDNIPLASLDEQRRIAEVLQSVDEAIAATQQTIRAASAVRQVTLDALIQRALDAPGTEVRPLSDIAEIRTGLAKNKNRTGPKVEVPYLRVANVQDGWFNLADMQEIEVDPGQVDRYLLQAGDVLLTEGGDYDKLGRGGVWRGEIAPCLHQNHVFCVRSDPGALLPDYFALASQSGWGRAYFLTCAKRTTNLASINSSQLRAFPVPVIATAKQAALIEEVAGIDAMIHLEERQLETLLRLRAKVSSDLLSGQVRVPA